MLNSLHKRQLSKLTVNRSIALAVAITAILAGGFTLGAEAHSEHEGVDHEKMMDRMADIAESIAKTAHVKPEALMERKTKGIIDRLNLSDEEAENLEPKVKAVIQHQRERAEALASMLKDLKKTMAVADDAEVQSALEEYKSKQSALNTELKALEASLLEGLTVRQEAILTLSGVIGNQSGQVMYGEHMMFSGLPGRAVKEFKAWGFAPHALPPPHPFHLHRNH